MDPYTQAVIAYVLFGLALASLVVVSFVQDKRIRALEDQAAKAETERKASVTYTQPLRVVPPGSYGNAVTRRELRRGRKVDGS